MEKQASSKNIMLVYGLVLGIVSILISVVAYALGMHLERDWKFGVLGFIVMIVIIVMGIKKFKADNYNLLSFGQAVKIGVGIAIISALLTIVYNQIFANVIEPDYMEQILQIEKAKWLDSEMTEEQIETAEQMFKTFSGPGISSAIIIVGGAFFGFIISAIAGAIMKRSEEDGY
jgi:uncharacterized membrane protein YfcA